MDTGFVQVFVLTLAECVAPAGKSVCQQSQFEISFLNRNECEFALQQLIELKSESEQVIVDRARSGCASTVVQTEVFPDLAAASAALSDEQGWRAPEAAQPGEPSQSLASHQERLESLKTCDESGGLAPCKIGEIIIEGASEEVEVWRSE
jgi:hypothetical protein